jgi:hypothetical protein
MKLAKFGTLLLLLIAPVLGQERYVRPVDEAALDPSFLAFRTKLIAAAERRDAKFILSVLDPQIHLSFGGEKGIADFKKMWGIEKPNSKFWNEFLPVIKNGGSFSKDDNGKRTGMFTAPYIFSSFPSDLDSFEYSVILGQNVNLRERASVDSTVVAKLSYNVVKIEDEATKPNSTEPEWYRVKTLGGLQGFVKTEYVRSPISYRAGFIKKQGRWKMTFFIAGD